MFRSRVDIAEERISEMIMSRSKYTIRKKWKIQKREKKNRVRPIVVG